VYSGAALVVILRNVFFTWADIMKTGNADEALQQSRDGNPIMLTEGAPRMIPAVRTMLERFGKRDFVFEPLVITNLLNSRFNYTQIQVENGSEVVNLRKLRNPEHYVLSHSDSATSTVVFQYRTRMKDQSRNYSDHEVESVRSEEERDDVRKPLLREERVSMHDSEAGPSSRIRNAKPRTSEDDARSSGSSKFGAVSKSNRGDERRK
jgi:hypothetical protein